MTKIRFSVLIAVLFVSIGITSCSNSDSSGSSDGTSTGNYWPLAVNNYWTYDVDGSDTNTLSISGTDVFGGTTYYKINDDSVDPSLDINTWITKKGATYYTKIGDITISQDGLVLTVKGYEIPAFKDNLAVNSTWSGTISSKMTFSYMGETGSYPITEKYTGTILEKGTSVTIHGEIYDNVIKASLKEDVTIEGETTTTLTTTWFAEGVGPIKQTLTSDGETQERSLTNYLIN